MPTLSCFFAIYTEGESLLDSFPAPTGTDVFLAEMSELTLPSASDELYGPHATIFSRFKPRRGFLLGFRRELKGRGEPFFNEVRSALLHATTGLKGVGLDVLRLWPFPLELAHEVLPEDFLPEDVFSVGFTEMGDHGLRAETIGLSKVGQREITFEFAEHALIEEAALMCGHLADWLLEHTQRIEHGQAMSFGFDRITFLSAEGAAGGPFRGWHPPLVQRLLPQELFPGVGVLEVHVCPPGNGELREDLTGALRRALEQRLLLDELDLTGDSPHASCTAQVKGFVKALKNLVATREESMSAKDSGWRFRCTIDGGAVEPGVTTLVDLARRAPELVRFLALPHGVTLTWDAEGELEIDSSRVQLLEEP